MTQKSVKRKRVTFSLTAPGAEDVRLAGTFNNWDIKKHPMKQNEKGIWTKTVIIPPGTYEYKYLVGGEWWNDPENINSRYNEHGTLNSIVVVK